MVDTERRSEIIYSLLDKFIEITTTATNVRVGSTEKNSVRAYVFRFAPSIQTLLDAGALRVCAGSVAKVPERHVNNFHRKAKRVAIANRCALRPTTEVIGEFIVCR
jgi:hypothetical protein